MKILVFVEGTILMHSAEDKKNDFASYVAIGDAAKKIETWVEAGAEISYLTSRIKFLEIKQIKDVLKKFNFPGDTVHARQEGESYKKVVEEIKPDVLVEDDCKSIGGTDITSIHLNQELRINGIVVPEFAGIDFLPDDPEELKGYGKKEAVTTTKDDTY